jgi:hypothetical protein
LTCAVPLRQEGRFAIVTNVERNAVDGLMPETCGIGADGEIVWSWRAHAGAKLSRMICEATVANAGSPRRARISRKPLRGEGRLSPPVPVVHALAQIFFAREPRVQRPPGLPSTLLLFEGDGRCKSSGEFRREDEKVCQKFFRGPSFETPLRGSSG